MTTIYVIEPDGITRPMTRLRCVSEDLELQRLLEQNPDLLPGDQIDPDSPRRWIQIQREMQDAVPTLIECKRAGDRCARREIVGQMLEYAANGARYWSKDELQQYAGLTSNRRGTSLADDVNQVTEDVEMTVDEYFELMHNHLRNGRMRLVFFLEDSAFLLKRVNTKPIAHQLLCLASMGSPTQLELPNAGLSMRRSEKQDRSADGIGRHSWPMLAQESTLK